MEGLGKIDDSAESRRLHMYSLGDDSDDDGLLMMTMMLKMRMMIILESTSMIIKDFDMDDHCDFCRDCALDLTELMIKSMMILKMTEIMMMMLIMIRHMEA